MPHLHACTCVCPHIHVHVHVCRDFVLLFAGPNSTGSLPFSLSVVSLEEQGSWLWQIPACQPFLAGASPLPGHGAPSFLCYTALLLTFQEGWCGDEDETEFGAR